MNHAVGAAPPSLSWLTEWTRAAFKLQHGGGELREEIHLHGSDGNIFIF